MVRRGNGSCSGLTKEETSDHESTQRYGPRLHVAGHFIAGRSSARHIAGRPTRGTHSSRCAKKVSEIDRHLTANARHANCQVSANARQASLCASKACQRTVAIGLGAASDPGNGEDGWEKLAAQGLGFLQSLAATVMPSQEQTAVADFYLALRGALGRSLRNELSLTLDSKANTITVANPPDEATRYRLGNFGYNGTRKGGKFGSNTIRLGSFDHTLRPLTVLLYDANNLLLGRGSIE